MGSRADCPVAGGAASGRTDGTGRSERGAARREQRDELHGEVKTPPARRLLLLKTAAASVSGRNATERAPPTAALYINDGAGAGRRRAAGEGAGSTGRKGAQVVVHVHSRVAIKLNTWTII